MKNQPKIKALFNEKENASIDKSKVLLNNIPFDTIKKQISGSINKKFAGPLEKLDLICFSHLRWNFVFQRPQHLLTRFAVAQRVFFIEEPIFEKIKKPYLALNICSSGVNVLVPYLPEGLPHDKAIDIQKKLINEAIEKNKIKNYLSWYYTPMALPVSRHLEPKLTVYDCMDELSAFKFAPENLLEFEEELMRKADVMFTGGMNLYEHKKNKHKNVHGIPSSIDRPHFEKGLTTADPEDQANIPHPRVGFFGVIDERMNLELLDGLAKELPDWNIIMIGPVVKIDPATLPKHKNIHYLGGKNYQELPAYLGNWDVAMLPFALNESTRFISPTKTPEYLAAQKPVVSTSIIDVVNPYGNNGLVHIADTAKEFAACIEKAYAQKTDKQWLGAVNDFLSKNSWDITWSKINNLMKQALEKKLNPPEPHVNGKQLLKNPLSNGHKVSAAYDTPTSFSSLMVDKISPLIDGVNPDIRVGNNAIFDYLIVGAGFAGSVLAERLASTGKKVLVIDKRDHIGGNAYDCYNEDGILIHKYGPHIFHTNSLDVFEHLSKFTKWRNYEHRVLASVDGLLVPMPINLNTINQLYGFKFNSFELDDYFESIAEHRDKLLTSEDVVVSKVGRSLYEKFFKGYTNKQWGLDPSELNASVTARVPVRTNRDDRYFTDKYQAMPLHGYTRMFQNMLNHPNIKVMLNTDFREIKNIIPFREMVYSGPVDEFFNFQYGKLPYRSLEFVFETLDMPKYQDTGTINYPNENLYTRITEFKYLTGQQHHKTSLVYEYPKAEGDPYYPVPRPENNELYKKYEKLAESRPDVHFVGRLATYKYYNMDQVVAQALSTFDKIKKSEEAKKELLNHVKSNRYVQS